MKVMSLNNGWFVTLFYRIFTAEESYITSVMQLARIMLPVVVFKPISFSFPPKIILKSILKYV